MTEQEENVLICEKLLGWEKHPDPDIVGWWRPPDGGAFISLIHKEFPTFIDWAGAGLILEALQLKGYINLHVRIGYWRIEAGAIDSDKELGPFATGPLAIRAAALAYIRDAPQAGDSNAP